MDFNSILIGSEDPDRLVEYYGRLFGPATFSDGQYSGWQLGSGFLTVGPHSEVKGKSVHPGRVIWNLETTDVAGDFERRSSSRSRTASRAPTSAARSRPWPIRTTTTSSSWHRWGRLRARSLDDAARRSKARDSPRQRLNRQAAP